MSRNRCPIAREGEAHDETTCGWCTPGLMIAWRALSEIRTLVTDAAVPERVRVPVQAICDRVLGPAQDQTDAPRKRNRRASDVAPRRARPDSAVAPRRARHTG